MTGLMYYRPDDHITYLQDCLHKVQDQGVDTVRWNLFIEQRRKTPLPPINANGRTPTPGALERDTSFITGACSIYVYKFLVFSRTITTHILYLLRWDKT